MPFEAPVFDPTLHEPVMEKNLRDIRGTLLRVRDFLLREAVHVEAQNYRQVYVGACGFNMGTPVERWSCGTVACIGGHAWLMENPGDIDGARDFVTQYEYRDSAGWFRRTGLALLFYPTAAGYDRITTAEAAQAIDNYLNTGNPLWESIV